MLHRIGDFQIVETLHEGKRSVVYRARRTGKDNTVVLKVPKGGEVQRDRIRALEREARMLGGFGNCEHVIGVIGVEGQGPERALVLEDFGASSLEHLRLAGTLPLDETLALALRLVEILGQIHRQGMVHRDFTPGNLLLRPTDGLLKVIDFASATMVVSETLVGAPVGAALAYASPEQTGRTNRVVDYRSDYYSFGIVLYELLTGVLPFAYADPLELVHAHIARQPRPPRDLSPALPAAVSNIVLKLLAKDAEARYQSNAGLRNDLARCWQNLAEGRRDFTFEPGQQDSFEGFRVSRSLQGRELLCERLRTEFHESVRSGVRIVALTGPAGIGKSSLARELALPVGSHRGRFAAGKFEQAEQALPFAPFCQSLKALAHQMLAEDPDTVQAWRARLSIESPAALAVLSEVCSDLRHFVDASRELPALPPNEARTRLQESFSSTLNSLATSEHPLCLFLDDLHWAPSDSLSLVKHLALTARRLPLLLVLAYRDDEVHPEHPLLAMMTEVAAEGVPIETIPLSPLRSDELVELVRDSVPIGYPAATELAQIVLSRTGGNPFFAKAFLSSAHAEGLIDPKGNEPLDLERIRSVGSTENIVALLVERIDQLPVPTQELLKAAACFGGPFDLMSLEQIVGASGSELWPAIIADLVIALDPVHAPSELAQASSAVRFRFSHDRIEQAVLSMLDSTKRSQLHRDIGKHLLKRSSNEPDVLLEAVSHLNHALQLMPDAERQDLARLNLDAARGALVRAAAGEALQFAQAGQRALSAEPWEHQYELTRDLHLLATEAAFAAGSHEVLTELAATVCEKARTPLEVVRVKSFEGQVQYAQFRLQDAMQTYRDALARLSIVLPDQANEQEIAEELRVTAEALGGREPEELLEYRVCEDERATLAMDLLSRLIFVAGTATSPLLPVVTCRLVRLSLEHGNTSESANAYGVYGRLLTRDHDLDRACRFGRLALDLAHRFGNPGILSQTYLYANYQLMHWKVPLSELAGGFQKAVEYGVAAGSPFNAACSATTLCICNFWAGEGLSSLAAQLERYRSVVARYRQPIVMNWHEILMQLVAHLRGDAPGTTELSGRYYDESTRLPLHRQFGDASALFNFHVAKALLAYLFGDSHAARVHCDEYNVFIPIFGSDLWAVPVLYLDTLVRLAASAHAERSARRDMLTRVEENLERLTAWLPQNRKTLAHKVLTIRAELARLHGDLEQSRQLFREATDLARQQGSAMEEGIAWELAARVASEAGDPKGFRIGLRNAQRAFARWGAHAKLKQLEENHPRLLPHTIAGAVSFPPPAGEDADVDSLDLVSVLNASRAISGLLRRDSVTAHLTKYLVATAGADSGYLLFPKDGQWVVECGISNALGAVTMLESVPLKDFASSDTSIPSSVINYVVGTKEPLLLHDACSDERFARDPVVAKRNVRSILCFPLERRGSLIAIAYLENRLVRGAFAEGRLKILEMLSAQAVISLENANLYDDMERNVKARTREVEERNSELRSALDRLKEIQQQLVTQEKLAAIGALTAGVAHEIRNPLNFVINFADIGGGLASEIREVMVGGGGLGHIDALLQRLEVALAKVSEHGTRASAIVSGMALHGRDSGGAREAVDLNRLIAQSVSLALHRSFATGGTAAQVKVTTDYAPTLPVLDLVVQDVSRVIVNIVANACYAIGQKRRVSNAEYSGELKITTRDLADRVEMRFWDNGIGIPGAVRDKVFLPFFTTKPAGDGTGLGLSIAHDIIVRGHAGQLRVMSVEGVFAEFVVELPRPRA